MGGYTQKSPTNWQISQKSPIREYRQTRNVKNRERNSQLFERNETVNYSMKQSIIREMYSQKSRMKQSIIRAHTVGTHIRSKFSKVANKSTA